MTKKVLVLMSTYNGEKYLEEQINSILNQEKVEVELLIRDDGSTDSTVSIIEKRKEKESAIDYYIGTNKGPAQSFLDLMEKVDLSKNYDYYALSDQDDYWLPDKLYSAICQLDRIEEDMPCLYYSTAKLVDTHLNPIISQRMVHVVSNTFSQAAICSNAIGCSMCFNKKLLELVRQYHPNYVMMHDGWIHKLCLAMNGRVVYDETPHILYRQHNSNVIGGTTNLKKQINNRIQSLTKKRHVRQKMLLELYNGYKDLLPPENKYLCELYITYNTNIRNKVKLLRRKTKLQNKRVYLMYKLSLILNVF